MRIGIIGAGEIGGTLARRLTALGHHVSVANSRGPESLAELAAETGAKPVSVAEAARSGEVVIVTIPEKNIPKLPRDLFAATPDRSSSWIPAIIIRDSATVVSMQSKPERRKADGRAAAEPPCDQGLNNIQAQHLLELGQPNGTAGRIALPVAGDDNEAKAVILRLVDELGLMVSMQAPWMSLGGSNPIRRSTEQTSMRRVSVTGSPGEQRAKTRMACCVGE